MARRTKKPHLVRGFFNPPKGGNATGVPTTNSMSPLPEGQPEHNLRGGKNLADRGGHASSASLRGHLEAGESSARRNAQESHKAYGEFSGPYAGKHVDIRNRRRPTREEDGGAAGGQTRAATARPRPDRNPNPKAAQVRSDGKVQHSMGTPDGNQAPRKPSKGFA